MLKLYGGPRTRGTIVQWYLEELGVPYELVALNLQAGEHKTPEYLEVHPMGKVPAIADGDFRLWESGAILTYLAEKYDGSESLEQRSLMNQWVLFANATLAPGLFMEATRERSVQQLLPPLDRILEKQSFLMGDRFTIADVTVGSTLAYSMMMLNLDLSPYPALVDYVKRLSERPAFQKTIGAR